MSTNVHQVTDDPPPLDEPGRERLRRARIASRPELMRSFNFNVFVPLWDHLRGTTWRDGAAR